jgi:hypothetical protein
MLLAAYGLLLVLPRSLHLRLTEALHLPNKLQYVLWGLFTRRRPRAAEQPDGEVRPAT